MSDKKRKIKCLRCGHKFIPHPANGNMCPQPGCYWQPTKQRRGPIPVIHENFRIY